MALCIDSFFAAVLMEGDHFRNLVADSHQGVQSGHGVLKDHGDLFAPDLAHLLVGSFQQVASIQKDFAVQNLGGRIRQNTHNGLGDSSLACSCLAYQTQTFAALDFKGNAVDGVDNSAR